MKRTRQVSHPRHPELPTPIAANRLADIKGGATAIEYGLIAALPPPTRPA